MKYAFLLISSLVLLSCNYERSSMPAAPSVPPVNYTITGTVRGSDGRPIEGADVSMVVTTKGSPVWKTDAAGRYQIRLTPSVYTFTISKPGFQTLRVTVHLERDTTEDFLLVSATGP